MIQQIKEISFLLCGLVIPLTAMAYIDGVWPLVHGGWLFLALVMVNNLFCLGRGKKQVAIHILNLLFILYVWGFCLFSGGLGGLASVMLFLLPIPAMLYPDRKTGVPFLGMAAFLFLFLYQRTNLGTGGLNLDQFRFIYLALLFLIAARGIYLIKGLQVLYVVDDKDQVVETHVEELTQMVVQSRQHARAKSNFLANMSHEIRNPMNGIIGMMHMLLETKLDKNQRHYANVVRNSAASLVSIVNDVLDISKIESGEIQLHPIPFDLELAIQDILSIPILQARQSGVDLKYSIDPKVPNRLCGDIGRIRQVLLNLIGNALKFTRDGSIALGIKRVDTSSEEVILRFSVDDTGVGIPEDKLNNVFGSFQQAHENADIDYGGTGLGLTIAKSLVEQMGGRMGVDSVELVGSTFWFEIPLEIQDTVRRPFPGSDLSLELFKSLVVGDEVGMGQNLKAVLDASGLGYEYFPGNSTALEARMDNGEQSTVFDLAIIEVRKNCDAGEILGKRILSNPSLEHLRLILVTDIGCKGEPRRLEKLGFSGYLTKPVDVEDFKDCVKAVLALPKGGSEPIITRYALRENRKQNINILVVDDMEVNRITAQALIEKQGYGVVLAEDGLDALSILEDQTFDMILMDCRMPKLDGHETTRQIRQMEADRGLDKVPIIAMTGNAFEEDRQLCLDSGMDDCIFKPVEPGVLLDKMNRYFISRGERQTATIVDSNIEPPKVPSEDTPSFHSCFDRKKLFERFENDMDLIKSVMDAFFQECPAFLERLKAAILASDVSEVELIAHSLKGSAANVNAENLKYLSFELEQKAKRQDLSQAESLFSQIQAAFDVFSREARI